jgi:hypothetical protein
MFKLNYETKTKKGEKLTPFLVEGTSVYCLGKNGKTIIKDLKEFDFTAEKREEVIIVTPMLESSDELFDRDTQVVVVPEPVEKVIEEKKPKVDTGTEANEDYI